MKFVCERCGVIGTEVDEMPPVCPTCQAPQEKLTLVTGKVIPTIVTEPEEPKVSTFGIRSTPTEIKRILKLVSIPTGNTPYIGFQKINLQLFADRMTCYQVAPGEVLLSILNLDKEYYKEMWGTGDLVLDAGKSLSKINVLNAYDSASILVDNENKILLHKSGTDAGFSDNAEDPSHVLSSKPQMPIPFDYDVYKPKMDEESPKSEFIWHVTVDAGHFKPLFTVSKEKALDYYPFIIENGQLRTGVGDMENPGMEGAFDLKIPVVADESVLPDKKVVIEVGEQFKDVMQNLDGKIVINFIDDELPLWILYDITKPVVENEKTVNKSFGTIGYVIPPRSD